MAGAKEIPVIERNLDTLVSVFIIVALLAVVTLVCTQVFRLAQVCAI